MHVQGEEARRFTIDMATVFENHSRAIEIIAVDIYDQLPAGQRT